MEQLGINLGMLLAQVVNFAILFFILKKFLYKPVMSSIDMKKKKTEEGLKLKQDAEKEIEALKEEREQMMRDVKLEGRRVVKKAVDEAKKQQASIATREQEKLREEREKMLAEVEKEREAILEVAKNQSTKLAILISEKMLGEKLDEKTQKKLIQDTISKISK